MRKVAVTFSSPLKDIMEERQALLATLKGTPVWHGLQEYFTELFTEQPQVVHVQMDAVTLQSDMTARFGDIYKPEAILELLENGYSTTCGMYVFNRRDFISGVVKNEEVPNA